MTARLAVVSASLAVSQILPLAQAQDPPAAAPQAAAQKIGVQSVRGTVRFKRDGRFNVLKADSQLTQGDTIVADIGGLCQLDFRHPTSGALLSSVVVRGYTEMTVAQAYQRGEQSRTQLDVPQGVIKAGVKRSATPPSFNIRTPRVVVGVRGTEIAELRVFPDTGDVLVMGREGTSNSRDTFGSVANAQSGQAVWAIGNGPIQGTIEYTSTRDRISFSSAHSDNTESKAATGTLFETLAALNPGQQYTDSNPANDAVTNSASIPQIAIPPCPRGQGHCEPRRR
jgi:hypothetical protein